MQTIPRNPWAHRAKPQAVTHFLPLSLQRCGLTPRALQDSLFSGHQCFGLFTLKPLAEACIHLDAGRDGQRERRATTTTEAEDIVGSCACTRSYLHVLSHAPASFLADNVVDNPAPGISSVVL